MRRAPAHGFTLLEVMVALAILALALMAIFDLNAGAVANHGYTKRLTVATLLARAKLTDLEQTLMDKGFSNDDDTEEGDFSEEGWPSFKWRARIIVPKTQNVPPEQLIGALFNLPTGGDGQGGGFGDIASMFGAAGMEKGGAMGAMMGGAMAGMAQGQFNQMVQQLSQAVREVHLTVSWKDGDQTESFDVVTHVVSLGAGSDRNGFTPGQTPASANAAEELQQQQRQQQLQQQQQQGGLPGVPQPGPGGIPQLNPWNGMPPRRGGSTQ